MNMLGNLDWLPGYVFGIKNADDHPDRIVDLDLDDPCIGPKNSGKKMNQKRKQLSKDQFFILAVLIFLSVVFTFRFLLIEWLPWLEYLKVPPRGFQPLFVAAFLSYLLLCDLIIHKLYPAWNDEVATKKRFIEGYQAYCKERYDKAIHFFQKAAENESSADALLFIARSEYYLQNYQKALSHLDSAESCTNKLSTTCDNITGLKGQIFFAMGEPQKARDIFDQMITSGRESAGAYRFRGEAYLRLGLYDQALEDLNRSIDLKSNDPVAYHFRANLYLKKDNTEAAFHDLETALKCSPKFPPALMLLGLMTQVYRDDFSGALKLVDRAVLLKPDDTSYLKERVLVCFRAGKEEKALAYLNELINQEPDYVEALAIRGVHFHHHGDLESACLDYNSILKLEPRNQEVRLNLTEIALFQGKYQEVLDMCRVELESGAGDDFDGFFQILYRLFRLIAEVVLEKSFFESEKTLKSNCPQQIKQPFLFTSVENWLDHVTLSGDKKETITENIAWVQNRFSEDAIKLGQWLQGASI
jgi:tetratricopeptide (TPR) repeat protein